MTTTITRLTPVGTGAVATLAVEGPSAWEQVRGLFRPMKGDLPAQPTAGRFWFGRLGDDTGQDEVIVTVRCLEPNPAIEIHCHGGSRVVEWLMGLFQERGCIAASPEDWGGTSTWARDGFEPSRVPPLPDETVAAIRADSLAALSKARTPRSANVLLDQANGAFTRALASIIENLNNTDVDAAQKTLDRLASRAALARHLIDPWRVVIAGPPNVGKSSILNAIHGYQRAIVSEIPGTTRDALRSLVSLEGLLIELTDTAGLRATSDELEGQGIGRSRTVMEQADLCVWVIDAASEPVPPASDVREPLIGWNKIDLVDDRTAARDPEGIEVSAQTGEGVGTLIGAIVRRLMPEACAPGDAVPPTADWADRVLQARDALSQGRVEEARQRLLGSVQ